MPFSPDGLPVTGDNEEIENPDLSPSNSKDSNKKNHEIPSGFKCENEIFQDFIKEGLLNETQKSHLQNLIRVMRAEKDLQDLFRKIYKSMYYSQEFINILRTKIREEKANEVPKGWLNITNILDEFINDNLLLKIQGFKLRKIVDDMMKEEQWKQDFMVVNFGKKEKISITYYSEKFVAVVREKIRDFLPPIPKGWKGEEEVKDYLKHKGGILFGNKFDPTNEILFNRLVKEFQEKYKDQMFESRSRKLVKVDGKKIFIYLDELSIYFDSTLLNEFLLAFQTKKQENWSRKSESLNKEVEKPSLSQNDQDDDQDSEMPTGFKYENIDENVDDFVIPDKNN